MRRTAHAPLSNLWFALQTANSFDTGLLLDVVLSTLSLKMVALLSYRNHLQHQGSKATTTACLADGLRYVGMLQPALSWPFPSRLTLESTTCSTSIPTCD
jgi:hypothetical protein